MPRSRKLQCVREFCVGALPNTKAFMCAHSPPYNMGEPEDAGLGKGLWMRALAGME